MLDDLSKVPPAAASPIRRLLAAADARLPGTLEALWVEGSIALGDYHLFHATRADLLRRLGRREEAAAAYRRALEGVSLDAERGYLRRRLAECVEPATRTTTPTR